ncbi:MAG: carboxypeptidase regulatory-like domain-containing protein [Gemmatimonadaceae bacterium]|nr:carboxypeptidase regulatory-like domain-containing protein [Gemmatimonadaceae bacterium]
MSTSLWYMTALRCTVCLAGLLSFHARSAIAQSERSGSTLRGTVTDTSGLPIANVNVVIGQLRRQTITRSDGAFQFDSVPKGSYTVSARRLGYIAKAFTAIVTDTGGVLHIRMLQVGQSVSAVETRADVGGVSGVIADTAFSPIKNVRISVLGSSKSVQTDSAGAFFLPLRAGQYLLRMDRDGYHSQTKSVMIPENEGRKIAAWLVSRSGPANSLEATALFDLNQRMIRSNPVNSKYYTREELMRRGLPDLRAVVGQWASGPITHECDVSIGGTPNMKIPLSLLTVAEIEFVEVYLPTNTAGGGDNRGVTSMTGNQTRFRTPTGTGNIGPSPGCGRVALIAWLKQ